MNACLTHIRRTPAVVTRIKREKMAHVLINTQDNFLFAKAQKKQKQILPAYFLAK